MATQIDQAKDVHDLGGAWSKLAHVSAELMHEEVPAREIAAVISHELGELTRRAAVLAEAGMKDEGLGDPPCRYAFAVLGSAGRGKACSPWIRTMR